MLQRNILLCFEDINIVKLFLNVTQKQTFLQFLFTLTTSHHSGYPLSLIHILAIAAHHHSIRARLVMLASACSSSLLAPHSLFVFPRRRTFFVRRLLLCSARRSSVARNNNTAHSPSARDACRQCFSVVLLLFRESGREWWCEQFFEFDKR